jgi:DNA-binding NtrC family response regulator
MIRVLFVDDEQRVLDGLKRSLRPLRNEFETEFASSGLSALEVLEARRFDVLVSDMRMPGMDGFALLNAVMERHPHLLRLALSGQSEMEAKVRAMGVAHHYFAKPCEIDELIGTVRRLMTSHALAPD